MPEKKKIPVKSGRIPFPTAPEGKSKEMKESREEAARKMKTADKMACPAYLSPLAKKEWRRVMRLYRMMEADILSDLDVAPLAMYCEAYVTWRAAQQIWKDKFSCQAIADKKSEQPQLNALIKSMNKQSEVVYRLAELLCLTPVGRMRMGVGIAKQAANEKDALAALLNY